MANAPVFETTQKSTRECQDCQALKLAFIEAVREVMLLNQLHLTAVMDDETDPRRFDIVIREANEQKQNAKYAFILHMETHGSSHKHAIIENRASKNYR